MVKTINKARTLSQKAGTIRNGFLSEPCIKKLKDAISCVIKCFEKRLLGYLLNVIRRFKFEYVVLLISLVAPVLTCDHGDLLQVGIHVNEVKVLVKLD